MRNTFADWGVATLPLAGEKQSGDIYVAKSWGNKFLAAVIDGLGHGKHAANAARIAAETLISHASESDDVVSAVRLCHETIMRTRGVVLSLALFDAVNHTMTWLGVGNVDGFLIHVDPQKNPAYESLTLRSGVVGYQIPFLRPSTIHVGKGDILIFSTDGIRSGFEREVNPEEAPQQIADKIMINYNRKTDDALVMVARYTCGL